MAIYKLLKSHIPLEKLNGQKKKNFQCTKSSKCLCLENQIKIVGEKMVDVLNWDSYG